MRLRQVALVAEDLVSAARRIRTVLGLGGAYADPGVEKYGLQNQVWPIGDTFLEVVSPKGEGTTAGRLIEKRGGDSGYMAIFQVEDISAARARILAQGVRIVDQLDRNGASFTHLHPKDLRGAIVSVDAMTPPERWEWGGPDWRTQVRTDVSVEIRGVEVQGEDPSLIAASWGAALGCPVERAGSGWRLVVRGGEVRFVELKDERGEGLRGFDVAVHDPKALIVRADAQDCLSPQGQVMLCGAEARLVEV